MIKRLCFSFVSFFAFVPFVFSQAGIGVVSDSFEKDYRNTPFPRDKNAKIIEERELLQNLPTEKSSETVYVSDFDFMGNRVISKDELRLELLDYLERNLTLKELNEAAEVITAYYRKKGYIISYAYIPPQIVNNSSVVMNIVEGEIGEVIVEGLSDYKKDFVLRYLTPLKTGIILESGMLERRLLLLNSFMDLKVNATLKPGKRAGTSDIVVYAEDTNPYRITLSVDNYGSYQTDEYRLNGAAMVGNIIKSGDRLALNLSMGLDNFNPLELFFARIDYRLPFGSEGFKAGFAYSRSQYKATRDFKPLDLEGFSDDYSLYTEYPVILRSRGTLNFGGAFNAKYAVDKLLGSINSMDTIFNLGLSLYGEAYPWSGANIYYSLTFYQGLNGFLGGSDYSHSSSNPNADGYYEKFYFDMEYHQFITWFFRLRAYFAAQWTSGSTFSSEKFYVGGMYSVRGFESGLESGDYGYRFSLEAEFDLAIPQVKALVFYDRGQVGNYNVDFSGYKDASLDSAGVGFRFYPWRGLALKFDYGYPINSSRGHDAGWGKVYGRISYDF